MDASDTTPVVGWVAYLRKSTEEQANSLPIQLKDITASAVKLHVPIVGTFSDAISGKSTVGRDGLTAALAALKPGMALAVIRIDRLARNLPDFFVLVAQLRDKKCYLYSVENGYYSSDNSSQVVFMMNAYVAEQERKTINKRTARGLVQLKETWEREGRPPSLRNYVTRPPYGYARNKNYHISDPRAFEPVVEEQAVIDLMRWMWKANPVLSLTGMAEYLNSAEVKTRTGVPWSPATVSSIQKHNLLEADLETRSYAPRPNRRERGVTTIGGQQNSYANSA
jgi:DNA invertase Pin-like site-specific DNA recombinase